MESDYEKLQDDTNLVAADTTASLFYILYPLVGWDKGIFVSPTAIS